MVEDLAFGILISLLFISLVVLFCVILIKLYLQKIKKYNQQLFDNEINFQKTLTTSILETQEHLLTSISQDLHDDAGQQLTVINFQLENLKLDNPVIEKYLEPISHSVTNLSQTLRSISHNLNTNWLENNGLLNAIQAEVNRLKKNKSICINLKIDSNEKIFKNEEQIVIFRIFQEVINNVLKHAKATNIEISITTQSNFKISIQDNGIGFDSSKKTNSIGIQNCINRAKMIHYNFEITSLPATGTTVILQENFKLI